MSTKKPRQDKNQKIASSKQDFWASIGKDLEAAGKNIEQFKERSLAELARGIKSYEQLEERYWEERLWEKPLVGDQKDTRKKTRNISGALRQEHWPKEKREFFHQMLISLSEKGFIADSSLDWKRIFEGHFSDHMKECSGPRIRWLRSIAAYKFLYDSTFRDLHDLAMLTLTNDKGIFWSALHEVRRETAFRRRSHPKVDR